MSDQDTLRKHLIQHHHRGHFKCNKIGCGYEANTTRYKMMHHYFSSHGTYFCKATGCGQTFLSYRLLCIHQHSMKDGHELPFKCKWPGCSRLYPKQYTVVKHINKDHLSTFPIGTVVQKALKLVPGMPPNVTTINHLFENRFVSFHV